MSSPLPWPLQTLTLSLNVKNAFIRLSNYSHAQRGGGLRLIHFLFIRWLSSPSWLRNLIMVFFLPELLLWNEQGLQNKWFIWLLLSGSEDLLLQLVRERNIERMKHMSSVMSFIQWEMDRWIDVKFVNIIVHMNRLWQRWRGRYVSWFNMFTWHTLCTSYTRQSNKLLISFTFRNKDLQFQEHLIAARIYSVKLHWTI